VSGFNGGVYMNYTISGNVLITFTHLSGGANAVLSGLFLDPALKTTPTMETVKDVHAPVALTANPSSPTGKLDTLPVAANFPVLVAGSAAGPNLDSVHRFKRRTHGSARVGSSGAGSGQLPGHLRAHAMQVIKVHRLAPDRTG